MIDLVYEIRRRVDAELKPSVKMANPEMLKELADYYLRAKDTISKALIKELLSQAGEEWLALLNTVKPVEIHGLNKQVVKVYRGQTILVEAPIHNTETMSASAAVPQKAMRMYRGHPVL
jgi:hypothetical protein